MDKIIPTSLIDGVSAASLAQQNEQVERAKLLGNRNLKSEAEVEKAAGGFEALLVHEMLKAMWSTVHTTGLLGENSNQSQIYQDMLHQALADNVSEGRGIGVKKFLKEQLIKRFGGPEKG